MTASPANTPARDWNHAFRGTPDSHQYVPLDSVEQELTQLLDATVRGDGIVVLTAAPGAGKTVVCRHLRAKLQGNFEAVVLSSSEFATRRSLLQAILFELGQPYEGLSEQELRLGMLNYARRNFPSRRGLVLIVDEAHLLNPRLLEELRCLTNHAEDGESLVRVVLSAQLALEEMLARPELQALNYRITCHATLEPLSMQESAELVAGRLAHVGRQVDEVFTSEALETICRVSDGSPRCLIQLCEHTLAISEETDDQPVSVEVVRRALNDLKQLPLQWNESTIDQFSDQELAADLESGRMDSPQTESPCSPQQDSWASFEDSAPQRCADDDLEPDEPLEWAYDVASVEVGGAGDGQSDWDSDTMTEGWKAFETEVDSELSKDSKQECDAAESPHPIDVETPAPTNNLASPPVQNPAASDPAPEKVASFVEVPVDDRYAILDEQSGNAIERAQTAEIFACHEPAVASPRVAPDLPSESSSDALTAASPLDSSATMNEEHAVSAGLAEADTAAATHSVGVLETGVPEDLSFEVPAAGFDVVQPHWDEGPALQDEEHHSAPAQVTSTEPSAECAPQIDCSSRRPYARLFSRLRQERA